MGEALELKNPGQSVSRILSSPEYKDFNFATKKETAAGVSKKYRTGVPNPQATNVKFQNRSDETGEIVFASQAKKTNLAEEPEFIFFPKDKPEVKETFLSELQKVFSGSRKPTVEKYNQDDFRMGELAKKYDVNYQQMTDIVSKFLKLSGLKNVKNEKGELLYQYSAPLNDQINAKERYEIISRWKKNPFVAQADKDLYREAEKIIKEYNEA